MEAAVQVLRQGRTVPDGPAALVIVLDDVGTLGGSAVLLQCTHALSTSMAQGRSQGRSLAGVAVERPPAELAAAGATRVVDLFTDPCGWLDKPQSTHESPAQSTSISAAKAAAGGAAAGSSASPWLESGLQAVADLATSPSNSPAAAAAAEQGGSSGGVCVAIDSLSGLLLRHSAGQVLRLLEALQRSPTVSSILALVHRDLHSSQLLFALSSAATALLELSPVTPLQRALSTSAGHPAPAGAARLAAKRRAGRVRAETQYYALTAGGGVVAYAPPPQALAAPDAQTLVKTALAAPAGAAAAAAAGARPAAAYGSASTAAAARPAAAASGGGGGGSAATSAAAGVGEDSAADLARRLGGVSMRLGLSEEERAARERVVLPFERSGRAAAMTGPGSGGAGALNGGAVALAGARAAGLEVGGGGGGGGVGLGRIIYERDSDPEADSDEDPDDDLDL